MLQLPARVQPLVGGAAQADGQDKTKLWSAVAAMLKGLAKRGVIFVPLAASATFAVLFALYFMVLNSKPFWRGPAGITVFIIMLAVYGALAAVFGVAQAVLHSLKTAAFQLEELVKEMELKVQAYIDKNPRLSGAVDRAEADKALKEGVADAVRSYKTKTPFLPGLLSGAVLWVCAVVLKRFFKVKMGKNKKVDIHKTLFFAAPVPVLLAFNIGLVLQGLIVAGFVFAVILLGAPFLIF